MKSFFQLILLFMVICTINISSAEYLDSASAGMKFETGSWSEITAKAAKENKLIFLDAFAAWCGPCKWMAKNVFTDPSVGEFFNSNFVCAKIDMEKGEGIELRKKFGVTAFPTLLYISPDGQTIMHRTCGSTPVETFLQNGKDALNPEKQLFSIKKNFENNPSDGKLAFQYFELMQAACADADKDVASYFKTQKEADYKSADNWKIIFSFVTDPASDVFKYLLANQKEFEAAGNKETVGKKIESVYENGLQKLIRKGDTQGYEALKISVKTSGIVNAEKIIMNADMFKYQRAKDWKNYAEAADKYLAKYSKDDAAVLNSVAWNFYENIDDKQLLAKAAAWAGHAAGLAGNYAVTDTYASVLYKLGKKAEAMEAAKKALELAKKEGADSRETEELIAKIEKLK